MRTAILGLHTAILESPCAQVVEHEGQYQDSDGKIIDTASYRYVMQLKAADLSGPAYISCFNEQVRKLGLPCTVKAIQLI
eukprot:1038973-Pelagomonas_calceolata.AAC.3